MRVVALTLSVASAQTVQSKCTDGTSVGANACCADTDLCPPHCLGRFFKDTCNGDKATCRTCQCYGCCDDRVSINAGCTFSGCEQYLISLGDTKKAAMSSNGCITCTGENGNFCIPEASTVDACASDSWPSAAVTGSFLRCNPPPPPDSSASQAVNKSPPPAPAPPAGNGVPPPPAPAPPPGDGGGDATRPPPPPTTGSNDVPTVLTMGFTVDGDIASFTPEVRAIASFFALASASR
jgi:hypothetical protein